MHKVCLFFNLAMQLILSFFFFYFFLLLQRNARAGENFDPVFTNAKITLTPADSCILDTTNGNEFAGFTFVNPFYVPLQSKETTED